MTECERFIEEGIFKSDFFKPETRCDFFVDENRKKIWAVELDLLFKFDAVCKKFNLRYFLMYGSLLGAVRHNGFIPWDDDLDVAMPREDYEKFVQLSSEFQEPYFLQTPYTDKEYFFSFAKLTNDNTSAISKMLAFQNFHKGIFLDIFPLDNFSYEESEARFNRILFLNRENSTFMRRGNPYLDDSNRKRVKEHSGITPLDAFIEIQELAKSCKSDTHLLSTAVLTLYPLNKSVFAQEDFSDSLLVDFEGYKFPIPKGYERILRTIYNEYMTFPPKEKRGVWHSDAIFDADTTYIKKLNEMFGGGGTIV